MDTKERILQAALSGIDRNGVSGLTVRSITSDAGANAAAVNYYFGSKDQLLEEALERAAHSGLWGTLGELEGLIEDNRGDIRLGLEEYMSEFLPELLEHPHRLTARLHEPLIDQGYSGPRVRELNDYMEGFLRLAGPALRGRTAEEKRITVMQLWSALLGVGLMPRLFDGFAGPHTLKGEGLDRWISSLLDGFLV